MVRVRVRVRVGFGFGVRVRVRVMVMVRGSSPNPNTNPNPNLNPNPTPNANLGADAQVGCLPVAHVRVVLVTLLLAAHLAHAVRAVAPHVAVLRLPLGPRAARAVGT